MRQHKPKCASVLLEHDSGVMEAFFSVERIAGELLFRSLGSVPRSGSIKSTDRDELIEAVELTQWCKDHPEVFEGYVVPTVSSANDFCS